VRRQAKRLPHLALIFLSILAVMLGTVDAAMAAVLKAHHDLTIRLFPETSELEGRDRIRIQRLENGPIHLLLSPRTRIQAVRIDGHDHPYSFNRERLTSYAAGYLIKEQASSHAAMDYRRQALRNYATLVSPRTDLPLSRFRSRTDPATKAVGYDKSTMVFHMLRKKVGEDAFWASLRHFYGQFRFKHASWKDLQARSEKHVENHRFAGNGPLGTEPTQ